jgi:hypothetical protein
MQVLLTHHPVSILPCSDGSDDFRAHSTAALVGCLSAQEVMDQWWYVQLGSALHSRVFAWLRRRLGPSLTGYPAGRLEPIVFHRFRLPHHCAMRDAALGQSVINNYVPSTADLSSVHPQSVTARAEPPDASEPEPGVSRPLACAVRFRWMSGACRIAEGMHKQQCRQLRHRSPCGRLPCKPRSWARLYSSSHRGRLWTWRMR